MILWFRTYIYERQVQLISYQCTLCDGSCGNTGYSVSLWELLKDGVYQFELHIIAQLWERQSLTVVTIERRFPARSPCKWIVRLQLDSLYFQ